MRTQDSYTHQACAQATYEPETIRFEHGDVLVVFSVRVTEVENVKANNWVT